MPTRKNLFLALGLNAALVSSLAVVLASSASDGRSGSPAAAEAEFRIDRRDLRDYEEVTGTVARAEEFRVLHQASAVQPGTPSAVLPNAAPVAQHSSASPSPTRTSTPTPVPTSTPAPTGTLPPSATQPAERTVTVTAPPVRIPVPGPTVTVTAGAPATGQALPQVPQPTAPTPVPPAASGAQGPRPSGIPTTQAGRSTAIPLPQAAAQPETVTALAPVASRIKTGSRLYSVNGQPVIAIISKTTWWRELKVGVSPGADVEVLEKTLQQLGFAPELKVDREFTAATAEAVSTWEEKIGRSKNDGRVALGDVVSIPAETEVAQQLVPVGGSVQSLTPVLSLVTQNAVIKSEITPESSSDWPLGKSVELSIDRESKLTGKIDTQDRSATAEKLQLRVLPEKAADSWKSGTEVRVVVVREIRKQVLCVPVSFPRANSQGRPVIRIRVSGQVVERPVQLGLVADGWVQISGDFTENQELVS